MSTNLVAHALVGKTQLIVDRPRRPKTSKSRQVARWPNPWAFIAAASASNMNVRLGARFMWKCRGESETSSDWRPIGLPLP